jgi:hypothetical protein
MPLLRMTATGGTAGLRLRLEQVRSSLMPAINGAVQQIGDDVARQLAQAAPVGASSGGEGTPIAGDAPGKLKESFVADYEPGEASASTSVATTQPNKLRFVRDGRGPVYPVRKRALMWNGLPHPVRSAKATQPNDFVTPVLAEAAVLAYERLNEVVGEVIALTE